jgi:DNA-binding MarR family transcriptional regulator
MASGHDVAMGLRAAYWALHRRTGECLASRGVTADQFVLLALLAEEDGITQQELVRRASSDANTVRAMLVRLERRGLVARRQHPTDGRARHVTLTRQGRQTFKTLWTQSEALRQRLLAAFAPEEAETLAELLARACSAMTQATGESRPRRPAATSPTGTERLRKGEKP